MPNEIEVYRGVLAELGQAEASVKRVVGIISNAARDLKSWKNVIASNAPPGAGFPDVDLHGPTIDCREWPNGERIARVLSEWHQAKARVGAAYSAIPESQRSVVKTPQEATGP